VACAQSPIKVHEATKEKIRYAASMTGLKQSELVEQAVDEYVERHRERFAERLERAREALLGGEASALAYASGVTGDDVSLAWAASPQVTEAADEAPRRATSNHPSGPDGQSGRSSVTSARAASNTIANST
jgi:hypothetical protein